MTRTNGAAHKQDGGVLMNQCIHNIDLLRWMMGDDIMKCLPSPIA